jgi:hypothetical protein
MEKDALRASGLNFGGRFWDFALRKWDEVRAKPKAVRIMYCMGRRMMRVDFKKKWDWVGSVSVR